jgi:NADH:ubiquinone reductase (non-electrogenic)
LLDNFERTLEPAISDTERSRLKHIVIVGGGPTGVEFGAELYDFCKHVRPLFFYFY